MPNDALLAALDRDAESFISAVDREYYLNGAGLKEDLALSPIYEQYEHLYTRDMVDAVLAAGAPDNRSRFLREFVVLTYLGNLARQEGDDVANEETKATIDWRGQSLTYRSLPVHIMNETDRQARQEMDAKRRAALVAINPHYEKYWHKTYAATHALGFASYTDMADELKQLDLQGLNQQMQGFLAATRESYMALLPGILARAGAEPATALRWDLSAAFRAADFDVFFPQAKLLDVLHETYRRLGITALSDGRVIIDAEARPTKSPRAFCSPIRVPEEVMLVIMPHGGHDDYETILHEAGHAVHFASPAPSLDYVYRHLGDNSVTEGFAFLFNYLPTDRAWLTTHLGYTEPDAYLALAAFQRLYMLRRYAAKLEYELGLHHPKAEQPAALYAKTLSHHLGVQFAKEDYLSDVDDAFYAAQYLRAWIFESQLRATMRERFGPQWFESQRAGQFLLGLWQHGQEFDAVQLLQQFGYAGLDVATLQTEALAALAPA